MTSLSCKKLKVVATLKRGHQDQFIYVQKNNKLAAFMNKVYIDNKNQK